MIDGNSEESSDASDDVGSDSDDAIATSALASPTSDNGAHAVAPAPSESSKGDGGGSSSSDSSSDSDSDSDDGSESGENDDEDTAATAASSDAARADTPAVDETAAAAAAPKVPVQTGPPPRSAEELADWIAMEDKDETVHMYNETTAEQLLGDDAPRDVAFFGAVASGLRAWQKGDDALTVRWLRRAEARAPSMAKAEPRMWRALGSAIYRMWRVDNEAHRTVDSEEGAWIKAMLAHTRIEEAWKAYERAAAFDVNAADVELWYELATLYLSFGAFEGCATVCGRIIAEHAEFHSIGEVIFISAVAMLELGMYNDAASYFQHLVGEPPPSAPRALVLMLLGRACELAELHDYAASAYKRCFRALRRAGRAVGVDTVHGCSSWKQWFAGPGPFVDMAGLAERSHYWSVAADLRRESIRRDEGDAELWFAFAKASFRAHQTDVAVEAAERALVIDPGSDRIAHSEAGWKKFAEWKVDRDAMERAAAMLQRRCRGLKAKREFLAHQKAVAIIQRRMRVKLARKRRRKQIEREEKSAMILQSAVRRRKAKLQAKLARQRKIQAAEDEESAALHIQAILRGKRDRRLALSRKGDVDAEAFDAALKIQGRFRARQAHTVARTKRVEALEAEDEALLGIQSILRSNVEKRDEAERIKQREALEDHARAAGAHIGAIIAHSVTEREEHAALKLQHAFQGRKRKRLNAHDRLELRRKEEESADQIRARKEMAGMNSSQMLLGHSGGSPEENAARLLQQVFRRQQLRRRQERRTATRLHRWEREDRILVELAEEKVRAKAAAKVQKGIRGYLARKPKVDLLDQMRAGLGSAGEGDDSKERAREAAKEARRRKAEMEVHRLRALEALRDNADADKPAVPRPRRVPGARELPGGEVAQKPPAADAGKKVRARWLERRMDRMTKEARKKSKEAESLHQSLRRPAFDFSAFEEEEWERDLGNTTDRTRLVGRYVRRAQKRMGIASDPASFTPVATAIQSLGRQELLLRAPQLPDNEVERDDWADPDFLWDTSKWNAVDVLEGTSELLLKDIQHSDSEDRRKVATRMLLKLAATKPPVIVFLDMVTEGLLRRAAQDLRAMDSGHTTASLSDTRQLARIQLRCSARKLDSDREAGRGNHSIVCPFMVIEKLDKSRGWMAQIWNSEVVHHVTEPHFAPMDASLHMVCSGDLDLPLSLAVFDQHIDRRSLIGKCRTTVRELIFSVGTELSLFNKAKAAEKKMAEKVSAVTPRSGRSGLIMIDECIVFGLDEAVAPPGAMGRGVGGDLTSTSTLRLIVAGQHLAEKDEGSKSDPYIVLNRMDQNGEYVKVWQSKVIMDRCNVMFEEVELSIVDLCGGNQDLPLEFIVYDWDPLDSPDEIGRASTSLRFMLTSVDEEGDVHSKSLPLINAADAAREACGTLLFRWCADATLQVPPSARVSLEAAVDEAGLEQPAALAFAADSAKAEAMTGPRLRLKLRADHLDKKDLFGKADPYIIMRRPAQPAVRGSAAIDAVEIWRSEHILKTLNPAWQEVMIPLDALAVMGSHAPIDLDAPVEIICNDWDKGSKAHDLIGSFETTLGKMSQSIGVELALLNPRLKRKRRNYENSGVVVIDVCVLTDPVADEVAAAAEAAAAAAAAATAHGHLDGSGAHHGDDAQYAWGHESGEHATHSPWVAAQDENGHTYYHHSETGESQWECPPDYVEAHRHHHTSVEQHHSEWDEHANAEHVDAEHAHVNYTDAEHAEYAALQGATAAEYTVSDHAEYATQHGEPLPAVEAVDAVAIEEAAVPLASNVSESARAPTGDTVDGVIDGVHATGPPSEAAGAANANSDRTSPPAADDATMAGGGVPFANSTGAAAELVSESLAQDAIASVEGERPSTTRSMRNTWTPKATQRREDLSPLDQMLNVAHLLSAIAALPPIALKLSKLEAIVTLTTRFSAIHQLAARMIQTAFRIFRVRSTRLLKELVQSTNEKILKERIEGDSALVAGLLKQSTAQTKRVSTRVPAGCYAGDEFTFNSDGAMHSACVPDGKGPHSLIWVVLTIAEVEVSTPEIAVEASVKEEREEEDPASDYVPRHSNVRLLKMDLVRCLAQWREDGPTMVAPPALQEACLVALARLTGTALEDHKRRADDRRKAVYAGVLPPVLKLLDRLRPRPPPTKKMRTVTIDGVEHEVYDTPPPPPPPPPNTMVEAAMGLLYNLSQTPDLRTVLLQSGVGSVLTDMSKHAPLFLDSALSTLEYLVTPSPSDVEAALLSNDERGSPAERTQREVFLSRVVHAIVALIRMADTPLLLVRRCYLTLRQIAFGPAGAKDVVHALRMRRPLGGGDSKDRVDDFPTGMVRVYDSLSTTRVSTASGESTAAAALALLQRLAVHDESRGLLLEMHSEVRAELMRCCRNQCARGVVAASALRFVCATVALCGGSASAARADERARASFDVMGIAESLADYGAALELLLLDIAKLPSVECDKCVLLMLSLDALPLLLAWCIRQGTLATHVSPRSRATATPGHTMVQMRAATDVIRIVAQATSRCSKAKSEDLQRLLANERVVALVLGAASAVPPQPAASGEAWAEQRRVWADSTKHESYVKYWATAGFELNAAKLELQRASYEAVAALVHMKVPVELPRVAGLQRNLHGVIVQLVLQTSFVETTLASIADDVADTCSTASSDEISPSLLLPALNALRALACVATDTYGVCPADQGMLHESLLATAAKPIVRVLEGEFRRQARWREAHSLRAAEHSNGNDWEERPLGESSAWIPSTHIVSASARALACMCVSQEAAMVIAEAGASRVLTLGLPTPPAWENGGSEALPLGEYGAIILPSGGEVGGASPTASWAPVFRLVAQLSVAPDLGDTLVRYMLDTCIAWLAPQRSVSAHLTFARARQRVEQAIAEADAARRRGEPVARDAAELVAMESALVRPRALLPSEQQQQWMDLEFERVAGEVALFLARLVRHPDPRAGTLRPSGVGEDSEATATKRSGRRVKKGGGGRKGGRKRLKGRATRGDSGDVAGKHSEWHGRKEWHHSSTGLSSVGWLDAGTSDYRASEKLEMVTATDARGKRQLRRAVDCWGGESGRTVVVVPEVMTPPQLWTLFRLMTHARPRRSRRNAAAALRCFSGSPLLIATKVVACGLLPPFVGLLQSSDEMLRDTALFMVACLVNFPCKQYHDALRDAGAVSGLCAMGYSWKLATQTQASPVVLLARKCLEDIGEQEPPPVATMAGEAGIAEAARNAEMVALRASARAAKERELWLPATAASIDSVLSCTKTRTQVRRDGGR